MKKPVAQPEWITPQEASLEISIRRGVFISPDDIKQMRLSGRLDEQHILRVSNRLWMYDRGYMITDAPIPTKRVEHQITVDHVIPWLEYPQTIARLEAEGFTVPYQQEAREKKRQREEGRVNMGGRRK